MSLHIQTADRIQRFPSSVIGFCRLPAVAAAIFAGLLLTVSCGSPPAKPNILLIVLDAARADAFSCYGYQRLTTPHMDTLAAEGLRFTNAVSSTSWTFPSHASLFTGLSPFEHGAYHQHGYLLDRFETLAELLKGAGYRTAAFSNNPIVAKANNLGQGFDLFEEIWNYKNPAKYDGYRNSQYTNRHIRQYIDEDPENQKPFFIFINYMDTHNPYNVPKPYINHFLVQADTVSETLIRANFNNIQVNNGVIKVDAKGYKILRKLYDGSLLFADKIVHEILTDLDDRKMLENTMVIITSDHGEVFGRWNHFTHNALLYRPLIHVPLIISFPKLIRTPRVIDQPVTLQDIYYTIIGYLGLVSKNKTGEPIRDLLTDSIVPAPAFSMLKAGDDPKNKNVVKYNSDGYSLWTPDGKQYIFFDSEKWDCYDMNVDADEHNNLFPAQVSRKAIESTILTYRKTLMKFQETDDDLVLNTHDIKIEKNRLQTIKSLGYLGGNDDEEDYTANSKMHPHAKEHYRAARFFAIRDSMTASYREFRTAIRMSPESDDVRRDFAMVLYLKEEFETARKVLVPIYGHLDFKLTRLLVLGRIADNKKKPLDALRAYLAAAQLNPTNNAITYDLIRTALENDKLKFSLLKAEDLIDRLGNDTEDYIQLANLFLAEDYGKDITDVFIDAIDSNSEPSCIAVGYSLCKLENLNQEQQDLLPLLEDAEISTEVIDNIYSQLISAEDSTM